MAMSRIKNIFGHGSVLKRKKPEPGHKRECEPVRISAKGMTEHAATIHVHKQTDAQPVRTSSDLVPFSTPSWHSPVEHAAALLDWGFAAANLAG